MKMIVVPPDEADVEGSWGLANTAEEAKAAFEQYLHNNGFASEPLSVRETDDSFIVTYA